MNDIKKGDIVGRKSYGMDIIFIVKSVIQTNKGKIAILRGIVERVEADSDIEDLEIVSKEKVKKCLKELDNKVNKRIEESRDVYGNKNYKIGILTKNTRTTEKILTGKILHLDGDKKYSEKSNLYYKKMGLKAIVRNIPENRQPSVVNPLIERYHPDILVVTRS